MYSRMILIPILLVSGLSCSQPQGTVPNLTYAEDETFDWRLITTKGDIVIRVHPAWAPLGAARVKELTEIGFYTDCAFFRVVNGFVAQFGMNGNPKINAKWADANINDDPVVQSNLAGYVTFAKQDRPNTRSTQLFINLKHNAGLDGMKFAPIGKVVEGLDVVRQINGRYGEGPDQEQIGLRGNEYLKANFPDMDFIKEAKIENDNTKKKSSAD
jgi:peptidyl-prolyl cis-trans isomerase A (cyclophilin A)